MIDKALTMPVVWVQSLGPEVRVLALDEVGGLATEEVVRLLHQVALRHIR